MEPVSYPDCAREVSLPVPALLLQRHSRPRRAALSAILGLILVGAGSIGAAQDALPFEVSNPTNRKLPADEASRIYFSACERVAQALRPEKPPHLHPKFVLVLGAKDDETVRRGPVAEVHLKTWDAASFAQAVVLLALREILTPQEVTSISHQALRAAEASVSVTDLRQGR
jgi:hypothetical protein